MLTVVPVPDVSFVIICERLEGNAILLHADEAKKSPPRKLVLNFVFLLVKPKLEWSASTFLMTADANKRVTFPTETPAFFLIHTGCLRRN